MTTLTKSILALLTVFVVGFTGAALKKTDAYHVSRSQGKDSIISNQQWIIHLQRIQIRQLQDSLSHHSTK